VVTIATYQMPALFPAQLAQKLHPSVSDWIALPSTVVTVLAFSTLGALIVTRHSENCVGWLFCTAGLLTIAELFAVYYALYTLWVQPGSLPGGLMAAWVQNWTWVISSGLFLVFLPLLYPNGRLLSRRWKPIGWLSARVIALLNELRAQSQAAFLDIRRLIYDLRPPALDDLGLVAALQESLARYQQSGLECVLEVAEPLPALPAAVEVAVYRIALESLTNVARHAGARTCQVCLVLTTSRHRRGLCLEVLDDGCGLPAPRPAGVGLRSMRERAEELGGFLLIEGRAGGGTRLSTWLPVPEEEPCA
jgi:anti-sigma regulatory factor (Ser/Thr protein kinase)